MDGTSDLSGAPADSNSSLETTPDTSTPDYTSNIIMNKSSTIGADLEAQNNGSRSIYGRVSDFATSGLPDIAAATVNAFVNTGVEVGNFLTGDNQNKLTIADEFGSGSDQDQYYQENKGLVEGLGLAVGSLLPGLGAVKVLKLATAAGTFGETFSAATGFLSATREAAIAQATEDAVGNAAGNSLFGANLVSKTKAFAAGIADEAIDGAVFQTATLATMHASPLLDDNTISDNVKDIAESAAGFGLVGGLFKGLGALGEIKTAAKALDLSTKSQELVGVNGIGDITPGDRIVDLIDTKQNTPVDTTPIGIQKATSADAVFNREINTHFSTMAAGDTDLSNAMKDFTLNAVQTSGLSGDALAEQLGSMTKIGRIDDESVVSNADTANVMYVPAKIDLQSTLAANGTLAPADVLSSTLNDTNKLSKAYALANPTSNILPTIAHAFETDNFGGLPNSGVLPPTPAPGLFKYKGAQDAYKKGVDIYVDANGGTHINPDSTVLKVVNRPAEARQLTLAERTAKESTGSLPAGSKPLVSTALFQNLKTGAQTFEKPEAVVGDLGKVKLLKDDSLQVGQDLNYKFDMGTGKAFEPTDPLAANAQYVANALRGVRDGDVFDPEDLPGLEATYQDWAKHDASGSAEDFLDNKELSFNEDIPFPQSKEELLDHINDVKRTKLLDLLGAGKTADEIGNLLNVPQSFLTKGVDASNPASSIIPVQEHTAINTVRVAYDISHTAKDNQGNVLRGMQAMAYRTQLAVQKNADTVANYVNKMLGGGQRAQDILSNLQVTKTAGDATLAGAGEGKIFAANGGYGTIEQQFQRVGRAFQEVNLELQSGLNEFLTPFVRPIQNDPRLAAEWGNFSFIRHSTGEAFEFLDPAIASKYELPENTAVLQGAITKDAKTGLQKDWSKDYQPEGFNSGDSTAKGLRTYYTLSKPVADLERAHAGLLDTRNTLRDNFYKAQGIAPRDYQTGTLYAPPINATKNPFVAYVKQREGYAFGESGAHTMFASDANDLRRKISLLGPEFQAFTRDNLAEFKKAEQDYIFNRNFTSVKVKNELARKGLLTNIVPEVRGTNLVNDLLDFHSHQETQLLRDHIEMLNAKTFSQINAMGERFISTANSFRGNPAVGIDPKLAPDNPYASYIRTALGVSSKDQYPMWNAAQDKLESYADGAFNTVRAAFGALQKGIVTPEEATKIAEKMGIGNPYGETMGALTKAKFYGGLANRLPSPRIFSSTIGRANSILGATVIRIDALQQLVHAVTLPIMAGMEHGGITNEYKALLTSTTPGANPVTIPSFSRVLYNGIRGYFGDMFGPNAGQLSAMFEKVGMPRDEIFQHRAMINELTVPRDPTNDAAWQLKLGKAGDIAQRIALSPSKFVNSFNHFMAAHIGMETGTALGLKGQDLVDHMGTFTNRVLGNLTAGQRGAIFHGPVGQAIGLFQSYQFNLMQQVFRHIEEGNYKALAMGAGLQSSLFGVSSMPGYKALNTLIQTHDGNTSNQDLYSTAVKTLGTAASDYLLYGSVSGLLGTGLYSRGDINPKGIPLLGDINPLNIPSVGAGIRVYQNIAKLASNITQGGSIPASMMLALEHNGLSRPLGGLAELMQGYSTDNKGNPISFGRPGQDNSGGFSDLFSVANMSRLLGARPLDESLQLDAYYRQNAAKVAQQAKIESLGEAFKTQLYSNSHLAPDTLKTFANEYARDGGDIKNFNKTVLDWTNKAHTPVVNAVFKRAQTDPSFKSAAITMGGIPLPVYHPPSTAPASTETQVASTAGNSSP